MRIMDIKQMITAIVIGNVISFVIIVSLILFGMSNYSP